MDDLVRQGKVLYIGASNFAAWQVEKALGINAIAGWAPIEILQPMYNLVKRQAEVEILPMAQAEQLAVITYSPLGGGLLSGKYTSGDSPSSGRLIESELYKTRYGEAWNYRVAAEFSALAQQMGVHPAALAVAWVANHPGITAPIIGARSMAQLEEVLQCIEIDMTPELYQRISDVSPQPPPATDRNDERTNITYGSR